MHLCVGGGCFLALIFSITALGVPNWSYGEVNKNEVTTGLWRQRIERDGDTAQDDDNALHEGQFEKSSNFTAVEFNRASTIMSFLLSFASTIYYMVTSWCFIVPVIDIIFGSFYLILAIFAWAGAASWSEAADSEAKENDFDDEVPCDAGCGLTAFNGIFFLALGSALICLGILVLLNKQGGENNKSQQTHQPVATSENQSVPTLATDVALIQNQPPPINDDDKNFEDVELAATSSSN